ncbi:uncharacterized protein E0L32_008073 [Thyridium curvatum]|uniref:Uncharacterized protein n=1 Tax=Thyridium curvatum TaxID=1093900 RepID=A0A507AWC1_9PEZI|nr:uncharacterized protein E0L32_008073 [Thyridium curvatum]TPX11036.1 hypothetical protein E0L32_008073 [Thyridium curvatum]
MAVDCTVGLLDRYHDHSPPILGEDGDLYTLREAFPEDDHLNLESCISHRAWTLQERVLSPRVLHLTRDQVLWRCRGDNCAEGYKPNLERVHEEYRACGAGWIVDRAESDAYRAHRAFYSSGLDNRFGADYAAQTWCHCVSEFSARALTKSSEKLPAIAGLAAVLCRPELGKYLAGFWGRDLFRGLAWRRATSDGRAGEGVSALSRPQGEENTAGE